MNNETLLAIKPSGASATTAKQDNLDAGVEASCRMAQHDLPEILECVEHMKSAAEEIGEPWMWPVLAGIASRESRCGKLLEEGYGDYGNAFGVMQIDRRYHAIHTHDGPAGKAHFVQAAQLLKTNMIELKKKFPNWLEEDILRGAVAAYNVGRKNIKTTHRMDRGTTGNDYSGDVIARAQWLERNI